MQKRLDILDIWHVRNANEAIFAFEKKRFSRTIQRRLDYLFIFNNLQESVNKVYILNAFSTDPSEVLFLFFFCK